MNNYRWFGILMILTVNLFANVTEYQAVAENFLSYKQNTNRVISHTVLQDSGTDIAYVFNLENRGYIVVPIEKKFSPVKAYSFKNDFETLPNKYKEFLVKRLQLVDQSQVSGQAQERISQRWDFLQNNQASLLQSQSFGNSYIPNTYLLTSKWNQDRPYNDKFPILNGNKALTGCVQTAMGQLMYYHKHPTNGTGVATHTWNNEEVKTILHKAYNWDNMPNTLNDSTADYMKDEIAYLMRDLGITNQTYFQNGETWASYPIQQFVEYFAYSTAIDVFERNSTNYSQFIGLIKEEIDTLRPVLLGFPEYLTVADGYNEDQTGTYVHVNMGWEGHHDDFYNLDEDILAFQAEELSVIYNIKPCSQQNNDCYQNLESSVNINFEQKTMSGQIDNQDDSNMYEVYLKGEVTFNGHTGFAVNLYDSNKSLLISSFDPISTTLPVGKYYVEVSLFNSQRYYNPYDENNNSYSVTFATEALTASEKEAIDATLEKHPIIDMELEDIVITGEKRILINALDENGDTVHLVAFSNDDINTTFEGNVLVLTPNVSSGASRVIVEAMSKNQIIRKEFTVLIDNQGIGSGTAFTVSGIFENQEDFNQHEVILSGECSIEGSRAYSNQAFFTSVISEDGTYIVDMNDSSITHTFVSAKYLIGASLKQNPNGSGDYYRYEAHRDDYVLSVSCANSTLTTEEKGDLLGIDQSNINNFSDSDDDGIADNVEKSIDTDGDTVPNYLDEDSDNDGMSDKKEEEYGFDPLNPADANEDSDEDGVSNVSEINAGTDPTDQNDYPQREMTQEEQGLFIILMNRSNQLNQNEEKEHNFQIPIVLMIEAMRMRDRNDTIAN